MIRININTREVRRAFRRAPALMAKHTNRRLEYWGRRVIGSIQTDPTLFRHETGRLKNSLWADTRRTRRQTILDMGWGVNYGYVLERGPYRRSAWLIEPKRAKALRWRGAGGEWKYAKSVKHYDSPSHRRPHFKPWLARYEGRILMDIGNIASQVLSGELR